MISMSSALMASFRGFDTEHTPSKKSLQMIQKWGLSQRQSSIFLFLPIETIELFSTLPFLSYIRLAKQNRLVLTVFGKRQANCQRMSASRQASILFCTYGSQMMQFRSKYCGGLLEELFLNSWITIAGAQYPTVLMLTKANSHLVMVRSSQGLGRVSSFLTLRNYSNRSFKQQCGLQG